MTTVHHCLSLKFHFFHTFKKYSLVGTKEDKKDVGNPDDETEPSPVVGNPLLNSPLVEVKLEVEHGGGNLVLSGGSHLLRGDIQGGHAA